MLINAGYNIERAVNNYFEGNYKKNMCDPDVSASVGMKEVKTLQVHLPPSASSQIWLIGRRVTLGYTLSGGNAIRSQGMIFKFEGLLHSNKLSSKPKKSLKFSGANLLFECPVQTQVSFAFRLWLLKACNDLNRLVRRIRT